MITERELERLGFKRIIWNDVIPEWYILLGEETGDWFKDGAYRIGVRFNQRKGEIETARPFVIIGNSMMYLEHIAWAQELLNLYALLTDKRWRDPYGIVR
jgi:hypothetical protein